MHETQEMQVRFLGQEDALEDPMATHSSILAWRIPMDEGAWRATVHRVAELDTTEATTHKRTAFDLQMRNHVQGSYRIYGVAVSNRGNPETAVHDLKWKVSYKGRK